MKHAWIPAVLVVLASCGPATVPPEHIRSRVMPGLIPVDPSQLPNNSQETDSPAAHDATVPDFEPLARGTGTPSDQALARGDEAFQREKWDDALHAYVEAARLSPDDPAPIVGQVRATLEMADAPTAHASDPNNESIRRAVAQLRIAVRLDGNYGPAYKELGRALLVMGESEQALDSLQRAKERMPNDAEVHSALGVALLATGNGQDALVSFRRSVQLDPNNVARQTNLATALIMQGHPSDAASVLEQALLRSPNDGRICTDLGTAYLALGEHSKAMPHLRRAVEISPDRATFRQNLGYGLMQLGDSVGAEEQFRKAIALDPKLGSAWVNLGVVLEKMGRSKDARQAFERAVALDPTDPRPKANLLEMDEMERTKGK